MKPMPAAGLLILGTTLGLVLGRTTAAKNGDPAERDGYAGRDRITKRDRPPRADSPSGGVDRIRKAKPDEIPGLTRIAIDLSDPVEMHRNLSECLLHMDAANWREVVDAFAKLSCETGRDQANEWKLALFRSGQVAGEQAMNQFIENGGLDKPGHVGWNTLYGWSTRDAHAALAWLEKAAAGGRPVSNECYSAIIAGAALADPKDALRLVAGIPAEHRGDCAGHLIWNVVQNGGTEALDDVLQFASKLDQSEARNEKLADDIFNQATDKLLWKADQARDVDQAREVVTRLTRYGRNPTNVALSALQKYRWYDVPAKLNLLNGINSSDQVSDLNLPLLTSMVLGTMYGDGDRAAAIEWMNRNPDSPLIPHIEKRIPRTP